MFYEILLNKRISPIVHTFVVVMKELCMIHDQGDFACLFLRDVRDKIWLYVSNSKVYQTLMNVLSKYNRVNEALKLLEEMFLMCCTCLMLRLNFNIIIHCLYKAKRSRKQRIDWLNASSWFKSSLVTYGVMIHGIMHI